MTENEIGELPTWMTDEDADYVRPEPTTAPAPRTIYSLPVTRWAWNGDAKDTQR